MHELQLKWNEYNSQRPQSEPATFENFMKWSAKLDNAIIKFERRFAKADSYYYRAREHAAKNAQSQMEAAKNVK